MTLPEAEARMQAAKALLRNAQDRRAIASSAAWQASPWLDAEHVRLTGLWYEACKAVREAQANYDAAKKAFTHIVKRKPRK